MIKAVCPSCGQSSYSASPEATVCPYCGAALKAQAATAPKSAGPKPDSASAQPGGAPPGA